jgi:hypothetical protein
MTIIAPSNPIFTGSSGTELPVGISVSRTLSPAYRTHIIVKGEVIRGIDGGYVESLSHRFHRFRELADAWHDETDFLSSPSRVTMNANYLRIIGMGPSVTPFILQDLRQRGGEWYVALEALLDDSETSPTPDDADGRVSVIKQAWIEWGRKKGYLI